MMVGSLALVTVLYLLANLAYLRRSAWAAWPQPIPSPRT